MIITQARDQMNHFRQPRWIRGKSFALDRSPHRLPFRRLENRVTVDVRAIPTDVAHEQGSPRYDHVHPQAGQHPVDALQSPLLDAAT
jgi:hypothetical protein